MHVRSLVVIAFLLASCGVDDATPGDAAGGGSTIEWSGTAEVPAPVAEDSPVSLPSLTVAGQGDALTLSSLTIDVGVYGRLARTEVTQVFQSNLAWQSEGTYEITMPEGAVLSRLAMDVDGKMMEGELVEKEKARQVYESIVNARKDPALLEWQGANRFKMQVFPIPANGTKTIILAYEQVLPVQGKSVAYTYALPTVAREGRASAIGHFRFRMNASSTSVPVLDGYRSTAQPRGDGGDVTIDEKDFVPAGPLRVSFARPAPGAPVVLHGNKDGVRTFFVDVVPDLPPAKGFPAHDLVVALDTSRGIGGKELARVVNITRALLKGRPASSVRVVHGDLHARHCTAELEACLGALTAGGATNLEELLDEATRVAGELKDPSIILFSDGLATLGELDGDVLAARFFQRMKAADLRARVFTVAVGHAPDMDFLQALAATGEGRLVRMTPASTVAGIQDTLAHALRAPVLTDVTVAVKGGDVTSLSMLPSFQAASVATSLRPGEPLAVVGRAAGGDDVELEVRGVWGGDELRRTVRVKLLDEKTAASVPDAPIVTRFWARGHIAALESSGTPRETVVKTSQTYGVMSRATSFLVLENDEAYKRFQIDRRQDAARLDREASATQATQAKNLEKTTESLQARLGSGTGEEKKEEAGEARVERAAPRDQGMASPAPPPAELAELLGSAGDPQKLSALSTDLGTRGGGTLGVKGFGSGEGKLGRGAQRDISMTQGTPVILGSIEKEIVRRVVGEHAAQLRYCYERELVRTPGLFGKIKMKWVINGEGRVTQAQTEETQMRNANVEGCLATKIKTWRFPRPKGGGIVIVSYPFVFKMDGGYQADLTWDPRRHLEERLKDGSIDPYERAALIRIYVDKGERSKADRLYAESASRWTSPSPPAGLLNALSGHGLLQRYSADAGKAARALADDPSKVPVVVSVLVELEQPRALLELYQGRALTAENARIVLEALALHDVSAASALLASWRKTWLDDSQLFGVVYSLTHAREAGIDVAAVARAEMRTSATALRAFSFAQANMERADYVRFVDEVCRSQDAPWRACKTSTVSVADELPDLPAFLEGRRLEGVRRERRDDVANRTLLLEEVELLESSGDRPAALRALSELVEVDPHDANVRVAYGNLLRERGELKGACEAYGHTAQLDPSRRDMYREMMALHRTNPKVDVEECIVNGVSRLPVQRALSLVLTWEDDAADIDLHVRSPSGEEVYFQNKNGADGGLLYYDVTDGYGPEVYTLGQAEKGTYEISVVYYRGAATDVKATVTILENAGTPAEVRRVVPVELDSADSNHGVHVANVRL